MTDLYLIAHKVRGEPAFDIATQIEVEGETWWIVPTSGHRAYPFWHTKLEKCIHLDILDRMPDDIEDHYAVRRAPDAPRPNLLAALGIARPKPTITRRL